MLWGGCWFGLRAVAIELSPVLVTVAPNRVMRGAYFGVNFPTGRRQKPKSIPRKVL